MKFGWDDVENLQAEYKKGRAAYDQGKAAYDTARSAGTGGSSLGGYANEATGYLNISNRALTQAKRTATDFWTQSKPRRETDRTIARLTSGVGNPGAPSPPTATPGTGIVGIFQSILAALGL